MKLGETITKMSTRFIDLVKILKALGKNFEEAKLVKKILRSLSKSWKVKTTVIFDIKDFTRYTYDELIELLIAYEMMFKKEITEKEKDKKDVVLKSEKLTDGKKKSIALKIDTSECFSLSSDEEEMTMLAKKFRRAFRKGGNKYKRFIKKYGPKDDFQSHPHKDPKEVICNKYNKPGHIRPNCPKSKKKKKEDKGKKAMAVVWDATDKSFNDDSNENNEANLYCMALEEKAIEPSKEEEEIEVIESEPPNIEELELAFAKIFYVYKTYKRKCASLKLENASLRSENISLSMVLKKKMNFIKLK
ncbi:hypothetical protein MANES_01G056725v8 [Manihot esculenta]|uniref:Uncharacterized protein n=1 Tax=Manihot esculenta TaxID=3983 RepID=A0ACB7IC23_MANES|nr:hypothetical protein MANES_01G056725v8 [Manihot esculenta]